MGAFSEGFRMGGEMYDSSERMKMAKEQHEAWQKEQAGKEALRTAAADAGDLSQAIPAGSFAGPAPQGQDQQGGYTTQAMSAQDKMAAFQQKAIANGADPTAVQQYMAGQYQLQGAGRNERYSQNQEHALGFQKNIMDDLAKNKGDVGAVLEKHFLPMYNDNKLPGLNDGGTAKLVDNAMGGGKAILVTAKDGKQTTMPADLNTLQMLTGKAQELMMASSSPENYWKNKENYLKERQVGVQENELNAKIKVDLFGAQAKQALGAANASNAHAAVYGNMLTLAKENKAAGEAMKPFIEQFSALTPEEQQGPKGIAVLTQGAAAAAKKTGDVTGIITALKKPDADTKITVNPDGSVTKGNALYVPDPNKPGEYKPAGGLGQSSVDKAIAAKLKQQQEGDGGANPAAPVVAGRPFYNTPMSDLQRLAKKPRGVSSAEANDAAAELEARKGESRISAIPR